MHSIFYMDASLNKRIVGLGLVVHWGWGLVSVRIAGGLNPTSSCRPPTSGQKSNPGGRVSTSPPRFCWSWYAAWFTLPSNHAVLKISMAWWFECYYYLNSYWRLGLSSPGLSVKFLLRTWICNNVKKQIWFLPLPKYWTVKVIVEMIKFSNYKNRWNT